MNPIIPSPPSGQTIVSFNGHHHKGRFLAILVKTIRTLLTAFTAMLSLTDANGTTFTSNAAISVGNTTYDGQDIIVQGCTLTVDGQHAFASLQVTNGGVLSHSSAPNGEANNRVGLTIVGNASVDATSSINAAGLGYAANKGPGAGGQTSNGYAGGGHAGNGGNASPGSGGGAIYGSIPEPGTHGSGGNNQGGAGGGVIGLAVGGTLLVDGVISANGNNASGASGGGGAGGSVFLSAGTLAGTGTIRADGGNSGNSSSGGGGGGRLALLADTLSFSGNLSAIGGTGYQAGGAGTIFTRVTTETYGRLRVDNAGRSGYTRIGAANWPTGQVYALSLSGAATVVVSLPITVPQMDITGGAMLTHERLCGQPLRITVLGQATIGTGASINVDGAGFYNVAWNQQDRGPGVGGSTGTNGIAGGGGYGGCGGLVPGITYGSYQEPLEFGSTSVESGSYGGGSVRLAVAGTLTVDGTITAGGQAGGSVYLTAATLAGTGSIHADGGTAINTSSGGGGGGRIALLADALNFSGSLAAIGGTGGPAGGAGTVYTRVTAETYGRLSLDNAGRSGYTRFNTSIWPAGQVCALRIAGAAIVIPAMPITVSQLDITTGAMITHERLGGQPLRITVLDQAMIGTGASINVDGAGYYSVSPSQYDRGPGVGGTTGSNGTIGGGGYGGCGGLVLGASYGTYQEPLEFGSAAVNNGSYGGGSVRVAVAGTLTVDGTISAAGQVGGAGGSIYLTASTLTGGGSIRADGGNASNTSSGGGGGGRVALLADTLNFSGNLTAIGGTGGPAGGAGTVFTQVTAEAYGQLRLDNAGRSGYTRLNASIWPAGQVCALRIAGAAIVIPAMPITVSQLDITTGAMLTHERLGGQPLRIAVLGSATIGTGASINVDGAGYYNVGWWQTNRGPGAGGSTGSNYSTGGAGHGGAGGRAPGATYGSYEEPLDFGSASYENGSYGGGSVRLAVVGTLTVDSTISAGGQGYGASGGSVYFACTEFAGGGIIQANGSGPANSGSGGGGGGRIAIYSATTSFLGTKTVTGGSGNGSGYPGGIGTIYLSTSVPPQFTSAAPPSSGMVGSAYNHTCTASGSTPITFTVSAGTLPTGLTLGTGGMITGTPDASGTFSGTITAANGTLPNATQNFSITIAPAPAPPQFTSTAPPSSGMVGIAYNHTCTASGTAPITFTVSAGTLPTGLTMGTGGMITGTPGTTGTFSGTITAANGTLPNATQSFSIAIAPAPVAPLFTSTAPTSSGMVGSAYNYTCTASGSTPITFTVSAGTLPTGLTLGTGGMITGTPDASGTFSGIITAANGTLPNATQSFTITIAPAPIPPTITTVSPLPTGTVGTPYTQALSATGGTTPYIWMVSSGSLPLGLILDNGVITGTPNAAATATFTVQVTGSNGASSTNDLSLTIQPASADLRDLAVSGCVLSPLFIPEVTSYTATTYAADLNVTPTTGNTGAAIALRCNSGEWLPAVSGVSLDGLILRGGINTVETRVTAFGGTPIKTYAVTITRWVPLIAVSAGSNPLVDDAVTPLDFGPATSRRVATQTLTISNAGTGELILGSLSNGGTNTSDFTPNTPSSTSLAPGSSTTLTITFNPSGSGTRTATIHLASNAGGTTNPFDVTLTGMGLSYTNDTDGDGMSDAAEYDLAALGFDWQANQPELVATLYGGANGAGLYTASQVETLCIGTPLLKRDPLSGQFKLTLGLSKTTDLSNFSFFPIAAPQVTINASGELELHFNSEDAAAFFRVEAK